MEPPFQIRYGSAAIGPEGQPSPMRVPVKEGPHDRAVAAEPVAERPEEVHGELPILRRITRDQVEFADGAPNDDLIDEVTQIVALLAVL